MATRPPWPADRVERWPIARLVPYARNARTHSAEQVRQLERSIAEWGWTTPVLAGEDGSIIAGHGRVLAALNLGLAEVPVMLATGWTEAQKAAYRVADNQLALNGGWNEGFLKAEVGELARLDFDLGLLGFDDDTLAALSGTNGHVGLCDPDEAPEPPVRPTSTSGDLWALGRHRLLCGDTCDDQWITRLLAGRLIDLVVTSPPYNQKIDGFRPSGMHKEGNWVAKVRRLAYEDSKPEREYQEGQRTLLMQWFSHIREGASVFYNHKNRYRDKRVVAPTEWLPGPFVFRQEIIWRRPGSITQNARMFLPCDERIYWLYKGDDFTFNDETEIKTWSTVWDIPPKANLTHAAAFPIEIPLRCIRAASMPDDVVYEPFAGSGTTIIAAEMTGRVCHAIEIDPAYVDVCVNRWQTFTGEKAVLHGDGRTFEEVSAERLAKAA